MGDKRNYAALDWVIGEIGETLKDARQALEAHVENPRDTARIRFCLTHIHQVHGSLQMVEFHGASLFAEEMELLAEALMHGTVSNENEAHEVLMRSLLQLPNYLEQVKTYQDDHPGTVLPLLNDLRAVRKQSLLSETNLFNPDLSSLGKQNGSRHAILSSPAKLKQVLQKLREMYQFAAASVLRGVKVDENLAYIDKVFSRLESISSGTASYPIWQVSSALVEALVRDDVELSVAVRVLLRHLARELRVLEANSASALEAPVREPLLRNLLYYVARAEDGGARVAAVKAQYGLDHALLGGGAARSQQSRSMISAPEPDAVRAVVSALQDELNTVKHLLDLSLSGQGGLSDVEEMLPVVKRIADTLAVLGIGDMRKQAMDQYDALSRLCKTGDLSDSILIDVAGRIADLEYRLEAIGRGAGKRADYATVSEREVEIDAAKETVLTECRVGLESVKEAIVESLSSQWNPSHLPSAVAVLHHVQGGLAMVPLPRAVAIVERCSGYIDEQLTRRTSSPGTELQTLADAIASIDYYLERLVAGHNDDLDAYLEIAEESLEQLGYPVARLSEPADRPVAESSDYVPAEPEVTPTPSAEVEFLPEEQGEATVVTEDDEPATELAEAPSDAADDSLADRPPAVSEVTEYEEAPDEEESDIDQEIIEIFVEEAAEVQQTLAEYFPRWRDNYDDSEALTEVRRAFHTLKGSGRMVEALDVGELAWSIENMLNRVLENTVSPRTEHGLVIEHALGLIPGLISAFEQQAPNPDPEYWQRCIDWANELANGRIPADLGRVSTAPGAAPRDDSSSRRDEERAVLEDNQELYEDDGDDQVLWDIFASEANSHLKVMDQFVRAMDNAAPLYGPPTDDLQRALHTLKGSAHMAAVMPIATMITPLEGFVKELRSYQVKINDDILQLIKDTAAYTREGLACIAARQPVELPKLEQFLARAEELRNVHIAPLVHMKDQDAAQKQVDPRLLAIFMAEDMRLLLDADQILAQWQNNAAAEQQSLDPLITELQTLSEGAEQANLPEMSALSSELQNIHQTVRDSSPELDDRFFSVMTQAHNALLDMVDAIAAGQNLQPVPEDLQAELNQVAASLMALPAGAESDELLWEGSEQLEGDTDYSAHDFEAPEDEETLEADLSPPDHAELSESNLEGLQEEPRAESQEPVPDDQMSSAQDQELVPEDQEWSFGDPDEALESSDEEALSLSEEVAEPSSVDEPAVASDDYFDPERPWLPAPEMAEESSIDGSEPVSASDEVEDYFDPDRPWLPYPELDASEDLAKTESLDAEEVAEADSLLREEQEEALESSELDFEQQADLDSEEFGASDFAEPDEESDPGEADSSFVLEPLDRILDPERAELPVAQEDGLTSSDIDALADPELAQEVSGEPESAKLEGLEAWSSGGDFEFELTASAEAEETSEPTDEDALDWPQEPEADEWVAEGLAAASETETLETEVIEPDALESESSESASPESTARAPLTAPPAEDWPPEHTPLAPLDLSAMAEIDSEDFDPDILEIFLEEANELIEELDEAIHDWESDRDNSEAPEIMKRALHTLKGGARLSGLKALGQLVHEYESDLIATRDVNADPNFFPRIQQYQDVLLNGVRAVRAQLDGEALPEMVLTPPERLQVEESVQLDGQDELYAPEDLSAEEESSAVDESATVEDYQQEEFTPTAPMLKLVEPSSDMEPAALASTDNFVVPQKSDASAAGQQTTRRQGPQEMIKVSADLLEELVNLAGETSISRGRLEQQVNDLSTAVDEVDGTLRRMSEQLRRLDIETEAQVVFRREQMEQHEHFDPLEMDRYSQLQQLTRSLMESNSDLVDLKRTLSDKIKDTETLLLQQSRINSSLQEGLMRSRMVPFSRLVPRLRRIVRQVSAELGKQVNFELDNVEGEMDRSVLERMVAPLEHMLRNAVDHGVETPAQRAEQHKPETGRILLSLAREGGDILLRLADDGRGIDLPKVRAKAIDRGLMASDAELSDHDVMQFILQAGFSTAENVTQISGRGVGMDVVASEIKQLGGSMMIDSQSGVGTQFTVRLPFTVSVNRALMVQLGLDSYAIPLNTIEGIVRVSPFELEHYYSHPEARFEYAGENYQVRHLGAILSADLGPKLEGQMLPLPVILVRSGQNTMALQVDGLMGSREIVVKSLGPQFAAVQGISGATVMGDGSVVVIIDPHALVRREMALLADPRPRHALGRDAPKPEAPEVHKTVMVVDDSVTVRKVTSRFLEREGYNVLTAKDGVDALQLLQEEVPDLMLLDIEMPRMDGFEVAKNIRSSSRLKHIPIIMITSRTGSKHREHALSIGVNDYVGKPYQEEALLKVMQGLLGTSSSKA